MPGGPESNKPNHEWRAPPQPQPESESNPLVPFLREQRGEGERSHEELVADIRKVLAAEIERKKPYPVDPVDCMRNELTWALTKLKLAEHPEPTRGSRTEGPHAQLLMAWDLISQPYYRSAYRRGLVESAVKYDAMHLGHTITLDAQEGKLLSAMAEAVGIPNPFGPMPPEKK